MPMTVPMQRGGSKSLPAELKVGGHNPVTRLQASGTGYGPWGSRVRPFMVRGMGMRGLGDIDCSSGTCIDTGTGAPVDTSVFTNPTDTSNTGAGNPAGYVSPCVVTNPDGSCAPAVFTPIAIPTTYTGAPPAGYSGPTQVAPGVTPPAAPAGYQWASLLNSTGQTLAKVLAISQGGSSVTLPNGTSIQYGSAAGSVAGAGSTAFTSPTALGGLSLGTLGLLAVGLMVFMTMGKK